MRISIHALLAESDVQKALHGGKPLVISIHALLAESDYAEPRAASWPPRGLSTLSLRRATVPDRSRAPVRLDFYPRSPCGERRRRGEGRRHPETISIHALLAESDSGYDPEYPVKEISIHALLAESDSKS